MDFLLENYSDMLGTVSISVYYVSVTLKIQFVALFLRSFRGKKHFWHTPPPPPPKKQ